MHQIDTHGMAVTARSAFLLWYAAQPIITTLLLLMLFDVITGVAAAFVTKKLNSSVSYRGMGKKALVWLMVGVGAVIEPMTPGGLPISKLVAGWYIVTELISILENAGRAGLPLPPALTEALAKLKQFNHYDDGPALIVRQEKETVILPGREEAARDPARRTRATDGEPSAIDEIGGMQESARSEVDRERGNN